MLQHSAADIWEWNFTFTFAQIAFEFVNLIPCNHFLNRLFPSKYFVLLKYLILFFFFFKQLFLEFHFGFSQADDSYWFTDRVAQYTSSIVNICKAFFLSVDLVIQFTATVNAAEMFDIFGTDTV